MRFCGGKVQYNIKFQNREVQIQYESCYEEYKEKNTF